MAGPVGIMDLSPEAAARLELGGIHPRSELLQTGEERAAVDGYGRAIALRGETLFVGAEGVVFVNERAGEDWREVAELRPPRARPGFGSAMAIDGDTLVVGAPVPLATDDSPPAYAFVFERREGAWRLGSRLEGPLAAGQWFGDALAIDAGRILVGASTASEERGAAYLFVRDGTDWRRTTSLAREGSERFDFFGESVALDGDRALIGASTGEQGTNSGSALVFETRDGTTWRETAKLVPGDGHELQLFGEVVALDGDLAIVGARQDRQNGNGAGAAYVFRRTAVEGGFEWTEECKLVASDASENDAFGTSVAIEGGVVLVGAPGSSPSGGGRGAAYVFEHTLDGWVETARLRARATRSADGFGASVAVAGDAIVVGSAFRRATKGAYGPGFVTVFSR